MCIAYGAGNVESTYMHACVCVCVCVCVCGGEYRSQTISPTERKSTVLPFITAVNADTNCQSCFDSFERNTGVALEHSCKRVHRYYISSLW